MRSKDNVPAHLAVISFVAVIVVLGTLATIPLAWKDQAVFGALLFASAFVINRFSSSYRATLVLIVVSVFCTFRYVYWRVLGTFEYLSHANTPPSPIELVFVLLLLAAELYTLVVLLLGHFQRVYPLGRKPTPMQGEPHTWPTVAVFVPTYNEPLEIVRPTVLASMQMDWPSDKLKVYLLDDGRREDFRRFADACGAVYVSRPDNQHAKAGNLNNALARTTEEFIAVFDCDHVPTRSFLQMTVGGFLNDEKLAVVQTPHHFYTPDPFERNLGTFRQVPNEGSLFYGVLQQGNDHWNAAFFCGSCAVIRRSALEDVGGFATETVTEDAHTSLRLQRRGWGTAYLNLPQAAGLATGSLAEHIQQRVRWARGMVQILRIENPLFASGLTWPQRLCYFNSVIHFLYAAPRLIFLTAPLAYLLLGFSNIYGYVVTIIAYALPHLVLATLTNARLNGRYRYSFWNEVYETVLAPYVLIPTWTALISPKHGRFNVTPKKSRKDLTFFDWRIASPLVLLLLLHLAAIAIAVKGLIGVSDPDGTLAVNLAWALFNTLIIGTAVAAAWEPVQLRSAPRVHASAPCQVFVDGQLADEGETVDISTDGAAIRLSRPLTCRDGQTVELVFPGAHPSMRLPVRVVGTHASSLRVVFQPLTINQERMLIRVIFGRADSWLRWREVQEPDRPLKALVQLARLSLVGIASLPKALFRSSIRRRPEYGKLPAKRQLVLPLLLILALVAARQGPAQQHNSRLPTVNRTDTSSFHEVHDLKSLGCKRAVEIVGEDGQARIAFGLPLTKVVRRAELSLKYRVAPEILNGKSELRIRLNAHDVTTLSLSADPALDDRVLRIELPADLLGADNVVSLHLSSRCSQDCPTTGADAPLVRIDPSSELSLEGARLSLANDLRLLPSPFFDRTAERSITIPFVFADAPNAAILRAAGTVASWFGVISEHRGTRFPVSISMIPTGNAVVFVLGASQTAGSLNLGNVAAPTIAIRDNPRDPFGKLLIVAGRDAAQLSQAARGLASGAFPRSGDTFTVDSNSLSASLGAPPRWPQLGKLLPIAGQVSPEQLRAYGTDSLNLYFRLPPDIYFGETKSVPVSLKMRYSGVESGVRAQFKVRINGVQVLDGRDLPPSGISAEREEIVHLPVFALTANNTLTVDFLFDRFGLRSARARRPEVSILPHSYIDLRQACNFTSLPKLELFANAGYPFTRVADLSETLIVLPDDPTPGEMSLYLGLLGFFGARSGVVGYGIATAQAADLASSLNKDLLVLGSAQDQPLMLRWREHFAIRPEGDSWRMTQAGSLSERLSLLSWRVAGKELAKLQQFLQSGPPVSAVLQSYRSPLVENRTVVAIEVTGSEGIEALLDLLDGSREAKDVYGNVSVVTNDEVWSFRSNTRETHVGSLPASDFVNYWGRKYFWLIPLLVFLVASLPLAAVERLLTQHARARLARGEYLAGVGNSR